MKETRVVGVTAVVGMGMMVMPSGFVEENNGTLVRAAWSAEDCERTEDQAAASSGDIMLDDVLGVVEGSDAEESDMLVEMLRLVTVSVVGGLDVVVDGERVVIGMEVDVDGDGVGVMVT